MNIINFSGGRTSAYMTKRLIDEGLTDYIVMFANTGKEMPQTLEFINECSIRWKINITWVEYRYGNKFEVVNYETASRNGRPFTELIDYKKGFLPNRMNRYCTDQLKIQTCKRYLKNLNLKHWTIYNGIRYDEPQRWSKMKNSLPDYIDLEMPLVRWKITKNDIKIFWENQSFDLNLNHLFGNCDCCFLKGKGKILKIAKEKPGLLNWWIEKENNLLNKGIINGTFINNMSLIKLLEISKSQGNLFENDPSFECFCNID